MNKFLITAALATTAFAAPAFAQDAASVPAGPRIEAVGGWDRLSSNGDKQNGATFGLGAGYDIPTGGTVSAGVDAEASMSSIKEEFLPGEEVKAGRDLYAGGRLSFAVSPTANLYAKGGYTNAKVKYEGSLGTASENLEGYRLGFGGQVGLGGKAYAGAEYRYSNYDQDVTRNQVVATIGTRF